jgi:hypothetical protein
MAVSSYFGKVFWPKPNNINDQGQSRLESPLRRSDRYVSSSTQLKFNR